MRTLAWAASTMVVALGLAGCLPQPKQTGDERLKQQAAQDTRKIRQDARTFAVEAKKEALHAKENAKAIVAGVREGLADPSKPAGSAAAPVDLNSATAAELETLPGVSSLVARRIISHRPYRSPEELVTRAHLGQQEYDRISDRVVAK